ncbi:MAG TPA: hypothetical protein VGE57_04105, partial [Solimonas sp.]
MDAPLSPNTRPSRRIVLPRAGGPARRWSLYAPAASRMVRVVEIRRETATAVTVVLESEDGRPLPFRAG